MRERERNKSIRKLPVRMFECSNVRRIGTNIRSPFSQVCPALQYLQKVYLGSRGVLDAFTWHHYYMAGAGATVKDFVNPRYQIFMLFLVQFNQHHICMSFFLVRVSSQIKKQLVHLRLYFCFSWCVFLNIYN